MARSRSTYVDQTTDPIAYDASADDEATALKALSNIGDNDVEVTGGPGPTADWVVEFNGALAHTDIAALIGRRHQSGRRREDRHGHGDDQGQCRHGRRHRDRQGQPGDGRRHRNRQGQPGCGGVTETVKGNVATVNVTETVKGNLATVNVTETQKGDAGFTVTVTKTDASAGSKFSWIAC